MKNGPSIGFNTFQLTSPRGDELKMARVLVRIYHFNSCLREETNVYDKFMYDLRQLFQLTSLQRDEQGTSKNETISCFYFNSRLRKETNLPEDSTVSCNPISIHVSARRRTLRMNGSDHGCPISTHVSARRRTNCRSSRRATCSISTHVSVRRRTRIYSCRNNIHTFQLTSP